MERSKSPSILSRLSEKNLFKKPPPVGPNPNEKWTSSENIVSKLFGREMGFGQCRLNNHFKKSPQTSKVGSELYQSRTLYQNLVPNFTVTNIKLSETNEYIRKFSPDGQHFITLADNLNQVYIYLYKGGSEGSEYFSKISPETLKMAYNPLEPQCIAYDTANSTTREMRKTIFSKFFKLQYKVRVPEHQSISRDLCLFTENSKFLIICSYGPSVWSNDDDINEGFQLAYGDSFNNPVYLRNYQIYAINLENGEITGTINFAKDRLPLSLKNGVYMLNNLITFLSIQSQVIYIYWLTEKGEFEEIHQIGQFCTNIEDTLFEVEDTLETQAQNSHAQNQDSTNQNQSIQKTIVYQSFKEKMMAFMYKNFLTNIPNLGEKFQNDVKMVERLFFKEFPYLEQMRMWKVQMIDDSTLMVKMVLEKELFQVPQEFNNTSLLLIYDIVKAEILTAIANTNEEVINLYGGYFDHLLNMERFPGGRFCTNATNNYYAKLAYQKCINSLPDHNRTKQVAGQLPIPAQNFSPSPYLDHALFSFDDFSISAMERPRTLTKNHLQFSSRESGQCKFTLKKSTPPQLRPNGYNEAYGIPPNSNYVAFHPTEPFALSVQRVNNRYYYNLHFRLDLNSMSTN